MKKDPRMLKVPERREPHFLLQEAGHCLGRARILWEVKEVIRIAEVLSVPGAGPAEEILIRDDKGREFRLRPCPGIPDSMSDLAEIRPGMTILLRQVEVAGTIAIPYPAEEET